jgi:hypothetical protein
MKLRPQPIYRQPRRVKSTAFLMTRPGTPGRKALKYLDDAAVRRAVVNPNSPETRFRSPYLAYRRR